MEEIVFLLIRMSSGPNSWSQSCYLDWLNIEQQITSLWCSCWTQETVITAFSPFPFGHPLVRHTHTHAQATVQTQAKIHIRTSVVRPFMHPSYMDALWETWWKWCSWDSSYMVSDITRQTEGVFPVWQPQGRVLHCPPSTLWREEWMTQVEDEKRQTWGSLVVSSQQMKERQTGSTTSIYSPFCRKRRKWRWGVGVGRVFPGFQCCTLPAPYTVRHTLPATFRGGGGETFPFVAMVTQDSLSFSCLSHEQMWANKYLWCVFRHQSR